MKPHADKRVVDISKIFLLNKKRTWRQVHTVTALRFPRKNPYLKIRPSLAIEYSILGKGRSAPSKDDVNPQRAPIAITYLAQGAPLNANTLGNVPPSGRVL